MQSDIMVFRNEINLKRDLKGQNNYFLSYVMMHMYEFATCISTKYCINIQLNACFAIKLTCVINNNLPTTLAVKNDMIILLSVGFQFTIFNQH